MPVVRSPPASSATRPTQREITSRVECSTSPLTKVANDAFETSPTQSRFHLQKSDANSSGGGSSARVISPPYFCCTKLEVRTDRGEGAYVESHDLDDVISLIDGRPSFIDEVRSARIEARTFIANTFRVLRNDRAFLDALPGFLPGDVASQARLPALLKRLEELAGAANEEKG